MPKRHFAALILLAASALAQSAPPESGARKVLDALLLAFNSADPAKLRAFDESHPGHRPPLAEMHGFREQTGGFTLLRVEKSEPTSIIALLQEKGSDTVARIELSVNGEDPAKIVSTSLRAIPRPADLALPRMSDAAALAALSAKAEELAGNDQFSGAVLVARHGKILLEKAWGRASRETGAFATVDTQFRVGSMNKMFTSIATLQLVERGKLALDDTIGEHLPDYPNKDVASKVKLRHLLTHTGGTGDIFGPDFAKNRLTLKEHGDYLKLYGSRGLGHEPGAESRYSNYGFVLLGALIEKVSGLSYYDYVRTKVFLPAGMTATGSQPETEQVPNRSLGYMKRDGAWVSNADTLPWRGTAAGGGYSTVGDLFRFAQAVEAGRLVSKTLLVEATRPQQRQYGYGFSVDGEGPLRSYGHGGGAPGMNGQLQVYPELGYVLAALSNLDPPSAERLADFYSLRMPATP